jgi:dihydrofolate reductase
VSGAFQSEDTGELNDAVLRGVDGLLLGRVTYEGFAAAWPSRSPKYVVSSTLERADWNSDDYVLLVSPIVRGEGTRLFPPGGAAQETKITESTILGGGMLALRMTAAAA